MSVRIIGLDEVSTIQDGNYIAIDSETGGTKKFDATKVGYLMGQNIAAEYNSSAQYVVGEFCMYDGQLYKCTTNITTPEAWNAGHWTQVTVGTSLYDKVDKVSGKGLSENDFTDALKTKLEGIAAGAEVNVQADWSQTNTSADDYIKNKPNVIEVVKVDGVALTPTDNAVDITGKANESIIASEYSTNESYVIGEYVLRGNILYTCTANTSGTWDSSKWAQVIIMDEINHLDDLAKLYDDIAGSTQTLVWTDDMVTSITHKIGSTTIRTDTFTYSSGTFTEVRTLNDGATLTLATDLSTYVTTVTYAGA